MLSLSEAFADIDIVLEKGSEMSVFIPHGKWTLTHVMYVISD